MQTIHVKNIEKYQPSYKDGRRMLWIRWDIDCILDYNFSKLTINQKWLLIGLTLLETREGKEILLDEDWICSVLNYPKSHISSDLLMLQTLQLVVTEGSGSSSPTDRHTDNTNKHTIYVRYETQFVKSWNDFCDKNPIFKKVREVSDERRKKIKQRYQNESFRNYDEIINAIEEQPFLCGNNDRKWIVSFDWLIANNTNYIKVLERKYSNGQPGVPEKRYM